MAVITQRVCTEFTTTVHQTCSYSTVLGGVCMQVRTQSLSLDYIHFNPRSLNTVICSEEECEV